MLKYSKDLLDSGLLNHARKSGSFYLISDHLEKRFEEVTLSLSPDKHGIYVKVRRTLVGTIVPLTAPSPQSVDWTFIDPTNSELNFTPSSLTSISEG